MILDPDGQVIELVQAPGDPAAPPRGEGHAFSSCRRSTVVAVLREA
jgi:hypothetical protein